jgi:hypothetical protein
MKIFRWGKGKWHLSTWYSQMTDCGKRIPHDAEQRDQNHKTEEVNWTNMCSRCFD